MGKNEYQTIKGISINTDWQKIKCVYCGEPQTIPNDNRRHECKKCQLICNDDITIEEIMQRANDCEKYTGVGLWAMNF